MFNITSELKSARREVQLLERIEELSERLKHTQEENFRLQGLVNTKNKQLDELRVETRRVLEMKISFHA